MVEVSRLKPSGRKWKRMVKRKGRFREEDVSLVEFEAPVKLVEAFDSALRPRFSSRSEALRYLMRVFVETSEELDWARRIKSQNKR